MTHTENKKDKSNMMVRTIQSKLDNVRVYHYIGQSRRRCW